MCKILAVLMTKTMLYIYILFPRLLEEGICNKVELVCYPSELAICLKFF